MNALPLHAPAPSASRTLVLRYDRTAAERTVVDGWLADTFDAGNERPVVLAGDAMTTDDLQSLDTDTAVLPVRVGWTAPARGARRVEHWSEALATVNARVAMPALQSRLLRRHAGLAKVVVAEPATGRAAHALRARYRRRWRAR